MPGSSLVKDICGSSTECRTTPLWQFSQSLPPLHRKSYMQSAFCTEQNVQECLSHISQEVSCLGLPPVWTEADSSTEMNVVAVLNCMYDLIQQHHRGLRSLENMEVEQLKCSNKVDCLQLTNTRLQEQLELSKREITGLLERERQLQLKVKSLQNCLKNEKEEVQKLQNVIAGRASQYNHEMKRKEREFNKLKERLNQHLVDKKERKQAIDILSNIGRADGKRSYWKTEKTEAKREEEMYRTLLCSYDARQRDLLLESAELNKVLQQMKKEMMSILRPRIPTLKDDTHHDLDSQADSEEEEEAFHSSKDSVELCCVHGREELINSIRLHWRRLKSHVETLDSQASAALSQMGRSKNTDAVSKEVHEEEMDRLKLEIQQCKDFIQTQQQLLQQQLSSSYDEERASTLSDCYILQEKERLGEEWKTLEEQRKIFERERTNFTEAAIRLSHERKSFEEDRAAWLKHQFLNLSPFGDLMNPPMSKSRGAFLPISAEAKLNSEPSPEKLIICPSDAVTDTTKCVPLSSPTTAKLCHEVCLVPENSSTKPKTKTGRVAESSSFFNGHAPFRLKLWDEDDTPTEENNFPI